MKHTVDLQVFPPFSARTGGQVGEWADATFNGWFHDMGLQYGRDYLYERRTMAFQEPGPAMLFKLTWGGAT